ncbi:MAG TPA: hypothetical protein VFO34_18315 [Candidatus Acidoferrales bacterium]|nr:hypothetical protein [Candidatus Acidoferrales bacterium]
MMLFSSLVSGRSRFFGVKLYALSVVILSAVAFAGTIPNLFEFSDPSGKVATFKDPGALDTSSAFFQVLGTNGRSCATCHIASEAMGLSAAGAQARFVASNGTDPLFAPVDGANCSDAQTGDAAAHSLMLQNALVRVAITLSAVRQFSISAVNDPYGCALVTDPNTHDVTASVYRRPLPATNLRFLSTVMFDGRETIVPLNDPKTFEANLRTDLAHQAMDATLGHAQALASPSAEQLADIVNFELGLSSAQARDNFAGVLNAQGANGGAHNLSGQNYYPGINDSLGADPKGVKFSPTIFALFSNWSQLPNAGHDSQSASREDIAAGEELFDSLPISITGVRGLNDNAGLGRPAMIIGTCGTCHDTPNVGNHSLPLPLDIGTGRSAAHETDAAIAAALGELSFPDLPVYELRGCPDPVHPGQTLAPFFTTDPGKALLTGQCADINRIKGPILRGLAARAPYFHNGAAATLDEVIDFYNQRFSMGLTAKQHAQLVAFLKSL